MRPWGYCGGRDGGRLLGRLRRRRVALHTDKIAAKIMLCVVPWKRGNGRPELEQRLGQWLRSRPQLLAGRKMRVGRRPGPGLRALLAARRLCAHLGPPTPSWGPRHFKLLVAVRSVQRSSFPGMRQNGGS
jgi:hypothetical protein